MSRYPMKIRLAKLPGVSSSSALRALFYLNAIIAALLCAAHISQAQETTPPSAPATVLGTMNPDGSFARPPTQANAPELNAPTRSPTRATPEAAAQPDDAKSPPAQSREFDAGNLIQSSSMIDPSRIRDIQNRITGWGLRLNALELQLQKPDISFDVLPSLQERVFTIAAETSGLQNALQPLLKSVERRLEGLTVSDADNVVASEQLIAQREKLSQLRSQLTSLVKQTQVFDLQANDLISRITAARRKLLEDALFVKTKSVLDPGLWQPVFQNFPHFISQITIFMKNWLQQISARVGPLAATMTLFTLLATVVFIWPARRRLLQVTHRPPENLNPPELSKNLSAFAIVGLATILPMIIAFVLYTGLDSLHLSSTQMNIILRSTFIGLIIYAFAQGLGRALLAPGRPGWRIIAMNDSTARELMRLLFIGATLFAIAAPMASLLEEFSRVEESSELLAALAAICVALLTMRALHRYARDTDLNGDAEEAATGSGPIFLWRWAMPAIWLAAFAALIAPVIGYIWFGWFLAVQIGWSLLILGTLHLLLIVTDTSTTNAFVITAPAGRMLHDTMALRASVIEQVGVILSGVSRLTLLLLAAIAILLPWGFSTGDIAGLFRTTLFDLQIGSITLSLSGLFSALLIMGAAIALTRAAQSWLENRFLPKTQLDIGLKSSISTSFGYIGYILGGLFSLSVAGLNLQNIAIVAGALSVGIGLGLQGIVNNFVSGLILLAERPIKVGDWVVVGADQGYVRRINVRATEIETFDRASVMVPNSNLISGVVKNWMHGNTMGRVSVPIGVSYNSDPEKVREILETCARAHNMVLSYPAPVAYFINFGASSLDFELRCYLGNVNYAMSVGSDLRFAIAKALQDAEIEIPFPQQDVHIRDLEKLQALFAQRSGTIKPTEAGDDAISASPAQKEP